MQMSSMLLQKIFIHFYQFMLKNTVKSSLVYRFRSTTRQTVSQKRNKRIDRGIFIYERCLWKTKKKSSY